MNFEFSRSIKSNFDGYSTLIMLYDDIKNLKFNDIILDFGKTIWFDANLTAVLGATLSTAQNNFNTITFRNLSDNIKIIFSRNYFFNHFNELKLLPDSYNTTIKYKKFKPSDDKIFKDYIDNELLYKETMPDMSNLLRKKINESIFEIFNNAVIHGECHNIFSCGQYYHKRNKLDFNIVDIGKTIKKNINDYFNKDFSGEDAIKWAVQEGHTTKQGAIPGGLGLSLIREFIEKNHGKIQIISGDGYWEMNSNIEISKSFTQFFPGTIVNLEFNIADKSHYYLSTEIDINDIF